MNAICVKSLTYVNMYTYIKPSLWMGSLLCFLYALDAQKEKMVVNTVNPHF